MNAQEELVRRLALKRQRKLGSLSDEAFNELELAVKEDPLRFVDDDEEQAFALVARALQNYEAARHDDDLLSDDQYLEVRNRRLQALSDACAEASAISPDCIDAQLLLAQASIPAHDTLLLELLKLEKDLSERLGSIQQSVAGDAWADVFARPRLRLEAAIARTCLYTARFRMAQDRCADLLAKAPLDVLGARYTYALAMARLEDEEGFNWLDAREGHRGNAWFHLSRVILLYKLGRMPAARRALQGFDRLCAGGAYLLLQPTYVETYLPDRPAADPCSFEETMMAVFEADPIILDVPTFAEWAYEQPRFLASAQDFCTRNGFEWREWGDQ